jgi:hypothetical protein
VVLFPQFYGQRLPEGEKQEAGSEEIVWALDVIDIVHFEPLASSNVRINSVLVIGFHTIIKPAPNNTARI